MLPSEAVVDGDDELDLRAHLAVLRRRWLSTLVVVVLVVGAVLAVSLTREAQYRAGAEVLIRQRSTESLFGTDTQPRNAQDSARQLNNEVRVLESGATRAAVREVYDGPLDVEQVTASVRSDTSDVVEVRVTDPDPVAAAELANLYVEVFIELRRAQRVEELLDAGTEIQHRIDALDLEAAEVRSPLDQVEAELALNPTSSELAGERDDIAQQIASQVAAIENQRAFYQRQLDDLQLTAGIAQTGGAQVLTPADPPGSPVSPQPLRDGGVALVLGIVLGIGIAFLRDNLDERIRTQADLTRLAGRLPVLALVPEVEGKRGPDAVSVRDDPRSPVAEAYRSLRTSVKFASIERPTRVLQVTSASSGEGKTTTVANLAVALAQGGDRVAVVCCDLRRPTIHQRFRTDLTPGFTDVLLGEAKLPEALCRISSHLMVLPAGSPPPNPSELLSSPRATAVVEALASEFDVVLLDTPPVLPVTDALVASRLADATLVVVDARATKRNAVRHTLQMLDQIGAPTLGLVLNGVSGNGRGYGYGYGYGSVPEAERGGRRPAANGSGDGARASAKPARTA